MEAPKGNILKIKGKVIFLKSPLTYLPLCYNSELCFMTYRIGLNHQASSSLFQARRQS